MKKSEFNFKKKFGQNFINDNNVINKIIEASDVDEETLVLEIGAGAGVLTKELCKNAGHVISYEIDKELQEVLQANLKGFNNLTLLFEDFLKANISMELKKHNYSKIHLVANLPYYITTPIITKIINEKLPIDKLIIMVQKEVGDRFNAVPSTKSYNSLTIFINYFYNVKKVMDVSRNVFTPKPNVDSIVLSMTKKEKNNSVKDEDHFFELVRNSFQFKRKNLKNNLKSYDLKKIEEVLKKYDFNLTVRAEQLSMEIFIEISNNLV